MIQKFLGLFLKEPSLKKSSLNLLDLEEELVTLIKSAKEYKMNYATIEGIANHRSSESVSALLTKEYESFFSDFGNIVTTFANQKVDFKDKEALVFCLLVAESRQALLKAIDSSIASQLLGVVFSNSVLAKNLFTKKITHYEN
jgi:hypothetical protein